MSRHSFLPLVSKRADIPPAVEVTQADLAKARQTAMSLLRPGVSVSDRIIALSDAGAYNVAVAFVARPASAGPSGSALIHDKIYYVARGSGTQVIGPLVNPVKSTAGLNVVGPGSSSTKAITGGRATKLHAGEIQIIPPGVGHVWADIADGGIEYIIFRVDPEHLLAVTQQR